MAASGQSRKGRDETCKLRCELRHGFTLIEMLIALAVGSLLMGGIYGILAQQRNVYAMHQQVLEMRQNVRMGLDVMTNDIRMAGFRSHRKRRCWNRHRRGRPDALHP